MLWVASEKVRFSISCGFEVLSLISLYITCPLQTSVQLLHLPIPSRYIFIIVPRIAKSSVVFTLSTVEFYNTFNDEDWLSFLRETWDMSLDTAIDITPNGGRI
jgi:hypothetical protein